MAWRLLALLTVLMAAFAAAPAHAQSCDDWRDRWFEESVKNGESLYAMEWAPFDRQERGWETYLPLIQQELGTRCPPGSSTFTAYLAEFQRRHGLPVDGLFGPATFQTFRGLWQERRPFVMMRVKDVCPAPPHISELGYLVPEEEHADRLTRLIRKDVLEAYRALVQAARREVPEVGRNPELLQIFSGFRDPEADAARCAAQGNCDGLRRATCSPHRTGAAVDLYVGQAPGMGVDNTNPKSRLAMTRGATYRWLVKNAGRFGFAPYAYEPWHWEWTNPIAYREPPPAPAEGGEQRPGPQPYQP